MREGDDLVEQSEEVIVQTMDVPPDCSGISECKISGNRNDIRSFFPGTPYLVRHLTTTQIANLRVNSPYAIE